MNTIEIVELIGLVALPLFIAWDLLRPHRRFRTPSGWRLRASIVTVTTFGVSIAVATLWGTLLGGRGLLDGARLGTLGGAVAGILVYEFVAYAYHRAAHRFDILWRHAHQMHHSAERLEALGANYTHPVDTFFFTSWSSLVFYPLLGLSVGAGVIAATFVAFNAAFQHANICTPRWLGYLVQRPESHGVHHERGVHRYNYADLPLVDMLFGTFRNPERWDGVTGFYEGGSGRIAAMLVGRDVSEPEGDAVVIPVRPLRRRELSKTAVGPG